MKQLLDTLSQFMSHTTLVHIYSHPNFALETIMGLIICFVHLLLILEIGNSIGRLNVNSKANSDKLRRKKSLKGVPSRYSDYAGVVRNHPDLGVEVVFNDNSVLKNDWDTVSKINKMLSTSLSEYIRKDIHKLKKQIEPFEEPINIKLRPSMEEVCDYLLKQPSIKRQLPTFGEQIEEIT